MGHRDEAIAVAQAGLDEAATKYEQYTMADCLQYCQESPELVVRPLSATPPTEAGGVGF